jgi:hypothetical protein
MRLMFFQAKGAEKHVAELIASSPRADKRT